MDKFKEGTGIEELIALNREERKRKEAQLAWFQPEKKDLMLEAF